MKRKFNGAELGKDFAFFFTVVGLVIGIASYVAFDITELWAIILVVSYLLLLAAYIVIAHLVDSISAFIRSLLAWHSIFSIFSVILSIALMLALNSLPGLYIIYVALCLIPLGYAPPAVHQIILAIHKHKQK